MSGPLHLLRRLNERRRDVRGRKRLAEAAALGPLYLDPVTLDGTELAIVGPAAPVKQELAARPLSPTVKIWRMNRGCTMSVADPETFGASTHILFHNLKFDGPRGNGPLEDKLLFEQGVVHILFPHSAPRKVSDRVLRYRKERFVGAAPTLLLPPEDLYLQLMEDLHGKTPTTGLVALALALSAPLKTLSIYGFTFFQTAYTQGYTSAAVDDNSAAEWARATGMHDPDLEVQWARRAIQRHREAGGFAVTLGSGVAHALSLSET